MHKHSKHPITTTTQNYGIENKTKINIRKKKYISILRQTNEREAHKKNKKVITEIALLWSVFY